MSKKVRTLLRVSSRAQLHDDDIPVQRAEAEQYIAQRPDWVFDKEYIEKAISAYKNGVEDREVLQQILADARAKQFDILLTYMSDRIGRQEEYSFYVATLNQLGIEVWTIKDGQLKTEEHVDKLLNYIRFWQNEGESKKTSMRVRDNQIELVKSGKFVGGKAPFGYRLVPSGMVSNHGRLLKKLEIVEQDAVIVQKIYSLVILQGMGYERIAKQLNEEKIPAITTDKWKASTIAGILKNPIYMGYYAINRRVKQNSNSLSGFTRLDRKEWVYSEKQIPELVIIEQKVWEKAQEIREARKAKLNASKEQYPVPFSTKGKLVLTGLAYCGYCGSKLKNGSYCNHWTIKTTGEEKVSFIGRYVCSGKCGMRNCYSQNYLEGIVFQMVEGFMEQLKAVDMTEEWQKIQEKQKSSMQKELQNIQKEKRRVNEDKKTLEEKIPEAIRGEYCFSAEKLAFLLNQKEQEIEKLQQKEKKINRKLRQTEPADNDLEKVIGRTLDWKAVFRETDTATKQMILSSLIDRIEVKDDAVRIQCKIRPEAWKSPAFTVP
ncbi:MAG: recombinase family protein [Lachnospiraceae bacterium]|nr:recombinase family protein [Lachnospiraceae bacterium]